MDKARAAQAEKLRSDGNDAYKTKDWARALALYEQSIGVDSTNAKSFSNAAAAACKLGAYHDAQVFADRATALKPDWGKAWWRSGVINSLLGRPTDAQARFSRACQLEPKNKSFRADHEKCMQVLSDLGYKTGKDGILRIELKGDGNRSTPPVKIAWERYQRIGGWQAWSHRQNNLSSEAYFVMGMKDWVIGLHGCRAIFLMSTNSQVQQQVLHIKQTQGEAAGAQWEQDYLGGHSGTALDTIYGAIVNCKDCMLLNGDIVQPVDHLLPPPGPGASEAERQAWRLKEFDWLNFCLAGNHAELTQRLMGIGIAAKDVDDYLPTALSNGTLSAQMRMGMMQPHEVKGRKSNFSATELVEEYRKWLAAGKCSWESLMQRLVGVVFRSACVAAVLHTAVKSTSEALDLWRWAYEFITAADKRLDPHLAQNEPGHQRRGASFRPYMRRTCLVMLTRAHCFMRQSVIGGTAKVGSSTGAGTGTGTSGKIKDAYPAKREVEWCQELIASVAAHPMASHGWAETGSEWLKVAVERKPLAFAHAHLALIAGGSRPTELVDLGLLKASAAASSSPLPPGAAFAVSARHYVAAATNELDDDEQKAILWWGAANAMCRTGQAKLVAEGMPVTADKVTSAAAYTVGELRNTIALARRAQEMRDRGLFGEDEQAGGSYEQVACMMEQHMSGVDGASPLPRVEFEWDAAGISAKVLLILNDGDDETGGEGEGGGEIKAMLLGTMTTERVVRLNRQRHMGKTAESRIAGCFEDKGADVEEEKVPPLKLLAVRELHKMGCGFAKGLGDPSLVAAAALSAQAEAPLCGRHVIISGLKSKPELNGTTALAVSFDDAKGRYNVRLPAGQTLALQPKNLAEA